MNKFLTITYLLLAFCPLEKTWAICTKEIIFIPQSHKVDTKMFPNYRTNFRKKLGVIESQLAIARYIERNSTIPVFAEYAGEFTFSESSFSAEAFASFRKFYDDNFPDTLPTSSLGLNDIQREKLFVNGAAMVQWGRGQTNAVHAVSGSKERSAELFGPILKWAQETPEYKAIPPEIERLIHDERDREALTQINNFFRDNPPQDKIFLIFGGDHNFQLYPELFPPECVTIPAEFRDQWTGKDRQLIPETPLTNNVEEGLQDIAR